MMANLRRRAVAEQLADLLVERQRRGYSERSARLVGIVNMAKAARAARRMSYEKYVSTAGRMAQMLNEERWTAGLYDAELAPHLEVMKAAEARAGLTDMQAFELGNGPADYEAANAAHDRVLDDHFADLLVELGLHDIAQLWGEDPLEYERLAEIGWSRHQETVEPVAAVRALVGVYERDADLSEGATAYYGACAMLGAAAEARLLAQALADAPAAEAARLRLGPKERPRKADPHTWTFDHLITVAVEAGWIGMISDEEGDFDFIVAALLHQLRFMRNYVHPGRHAADKPLEVLTKDEMADARAAYDSLVLSLELAAVEGSIELPHRR